MKLTKAQRIRLNHLNQHSSPVTRRDFMSLGLMGMTGLALVPRMTFASPILNISETAPAFLVFDLAGGAGLSGNFLVGNAGGAEDLLPSYDQLGWNPREGYDKRFGLPLAPGNVSKILEGIITTVSSEAQSRFRMGSLLHASIDDSTINSTSAMWLASKYNSQYKRIISQGLSELSTQSGGNSQSALADASFKPLPIDSIDRFLENFNFHGNLQTITPSRRSFLFDKLARISKEQIKNLPGKNRDELMHSYDSALTGLKDFSGFDSKILDPRFNSVAANIYGISGTSDPKNHDVIASTITFNAIKGHIGPSVLTIPGCDYHDGSSTTGDAKDLEIGKSIGRAIELAHQLKKSLFIQIITDGGVYAKPGTRQWLGDAGSKSMSVIGYYSPTSVPKYVDNQKVQIGNYTVGQGVERSTLIGESPTLASCATFANYLNISGELSSFEKYVPRGTFNDDQLASLLIFDQQG